METNFPKLNTLKIFIILNISLDRIDFTLTGISLPVEKYIKNRSDMDINICDRFFNM
jgi:hypothetical protein